MVNHLKSKGSECGAGDDDTTTGQGNCNGTRTLAAQALADWLASDPTDMADPDYLIIGDLNSYAMEDPIVALKNAGYTDLVNLVGGMDAYGYVFDGQLGYLDHALANPSLVPQVAGVVEWHINADEIPLFDYNDDVRDAGEYYAYEEESDVLPLYDANEFRTSDHDPVLIGLNLDATSPVVTVPGNMAVEAADASGAVVNFIVSAVDNVDGSITPTCTPPSGSTFPIGLTTVSCSATDAAGNTGRGSFTITVYVNSTATFVSLGAQDGHAIEKSETTEYGGYSSASGGYIQIGDSNADRQIKGFLSFDTSALPDGAVVTSVRIELRFISAAGTNPFLTHGALNVDIANPTFGATALAPGDFEAVPTAYDVAACGSALAAGWFGCDLVSNLGDINLFGFTQFRLWFDLPDNDDLRPDYLKIASGNNPKAIYRPVLIVEYYVP